jgi:hypothetical protein
MGLESFYLFRLDEEYVVQCPPVMLQQCAANLELHLFISVQLSSAFQYVQTGRWDNERQQRKVHKPQVRMSFIYDDHSAQKRLFTGLFRYTSIL